MESLPFATYTCSICTAIVRNASGNPLVSCLLGLESLSDQFLVLKKKLSIFYTILNLVESHNSHTMGSSHEIPQLLKNMNFQCRVHNSPPFSANRAKIKALRTFPSYRFRIHCNANHTSAPRSSKLPLSFRINLPNHRIHLPHHPYTPHERPIIFCPIASPG